MADEKKEIEYNPEPNSSYLAEKEMDLQSGWIGRFFGGPTHSPCNIAGLLIVSLALTGILSIFISSVNTTEVWAIIAPVITLSMGYLFGKNA